MLSTPRLVLRRWREADRVPFAAMNVDREVMRHFPDVLPRAESDALVDRIEEHFERHGFGLWAVDIRSTGGFAGFIGLSVPSFRAHFTPCVEIGWRLARACWGRGYATEGARAVLAHGFEELGLDEIVSFTTVANTPSRRLMERMGMHRSPADDFEHPLLPAGHPQRPHVLYRLPRTRWQSALR